MQECFLLRDRTDVPKEISRTVFTDDVVMHLCINPMLLLFPLQGFVPEGEFIACPDRFRFRFVSLIEGDVAVLCSERPDSVPISQRDFRTDRINRRRVCNSKPESAELLVPQVILVLEAQLQCAAFLSEGRCNEEDCLPICLSSVQSPSGFRFVVNRVCDDKVPAGLLVVCPGMHYRNRCPRFFGFYVNLRFFGFYVSLRLFGFFLSLRICRHRRGDFQ